MRTFRLPLTLCFLSVAAFAGAEGPAAESFAAKVEAAAKTAKLPPPLVASLAEAAKADAAAFKAEIAAVHAQDPYCCYLVDKTRALPQGYAPTDLVNLKNAHYRVSKSGLKLRVPAEAALNKMAAAAKADGIDLVVSSSYRSYAYQVQVYDRVVKELGKTGADRESARPGFSQHQLGLAVDFGSIDDSFALTPASRWLLANASRFGWSLSFPQGYEEATGYRWESWHFRYVGPAGIALIDRRFGGIQQYALQFLNAFGR